MKNKPLAIQIWSVFAGITFVFSVLIAIFIFVTLRSFFMEETYRTIETAQINRFTGDVLEKNPIERDQSRQSNRGVNHLVFLPNVGIINDSTLPRTVIRKLYKEALLQDEISKRYTKKIQGERIYYIIRKGMVLGREVILVSYMWDSYLNDLVRTLFRRLIVVIGGALLVVSVPAALLSKYLTRPLREMDKHVKRIAERDWHEPLLHDREDEIGRLARSIEKMREKLVQQDEAQKSILQHISHELKTPVMVVRSYAESIEDGVFPKENLEGSINVIKEEAVRLEKRIKDLLYLTKLDYYATQEPKYERFHLEDLLTEVAKRMQPNRLDLKFEFELRETIVTGDIEQWKIAFENILDNQMRYAETMIRITVKHSENNAIVRIWNDGPTIEEHLLNQVFQKFKTGQKGKFGLGLAIVQRIAELHKAKVWAENENNGVAFYVQFKTLK
jgi:two-component system, OmpR family, sensor histidine kinase CssS